MGDRNRWVLAGSFLAAAVLSGCQSRSAGLGQGLRREGPSPLASRTNPPGTGAWNNQAQPTLAGNSVNAGSRVANPQNTSAGLNDQNSNSRPAAGSPTDGTRTTAIPQSTGPAAGSPWPQAAPGMVPGSSSTFGSTPAPSWPPLSSTPSSRVTAPNQDATPPTAPTTSGSNYQTRRPSVPTMPPPGNGDE
jgi:hypothetical protein